MKLLLNLRPTIPLQRGRSKRYVAAMLSMAVLACIGLSWVALNAALVFVRQWQGDAYIESARETLPALQARCRKLSPPEKRAREQEEILRTVSREIRLHRTPLSAAMLRALEESLPRTVRIESFRWKAPVEDGRASLELSAWAQAPLQITETVRRLARHRPFTEGRLLDFSVKGSDWHFKALFHGEAAIAVGEAAIPAKGDDAR